MAGMRLMYFIPALFNHGGMERVLTSKVNYLVEEMGYRITIVTTDQMSRGCYFSLSGKIDLIHLDLDFNSHFEKALIPKYFCHQLKMIKYKREVQKLVDIIKPDILISLGGKEIDFIYKLKTNAAIVCEMHFSMNIRTQFLVSRKRGLLWTVLGNIRTNQLKNTTKKIDKLIVLTNQDKNQWEKTHKNVLHIPNPATFEVREREGVDYKSVISVGRLDPQKGYSMLIDTWVLVKDKHPEWMLNIFGTGDLKEQLEGKINALGLKGNVNLKGKSDEIENEYLKSSFFVMSSLYEGLPMVLLESMSCGLPVVSFDCEWGPREIIKDGYNGFLVETGDVNQLADKICQMIENHELRKTMSLNALEVAKKYDISIVMKKWDALFKELKNSNVSA
jgi:glycosyltransferase involved in cell wall biosynthesis